MTDATAETAPAPAYAELQVASNYSFLRGASHPDELVVAAKALGLAALAIADRNSLAGAVRAHVAAREAGLRLVVGARLVPRDGPEVLCFPSDRAAYGRLCRLLTLGKRRVEKGACDFTFEELLAHGAGQVFVVLPPEPLRVDHPHTPYPDAAFRSALARLRAARPDAERRLGRLSPSSPEPAGRR